jgi:LytS/YehU family sensor histidine kinase
LALTVEDTGAGATPQALERGRAAGVGLRNVERRLACQYGDAGSLSIRTTAGQGTTVEICLPLAIKAATTDVHQVAS